MDGLYLNEFAGKCSTCSAKDEFVLARGFFAHGRVGVVNISVNDRRDFGRGDGQICV
jgi:hypothetical protein